MNNTLAQLMDQYDQLGLGGSYRGNNNADTFNLSGYSSMDRARDDRMAAKYQWAQGQMDRQGQGGQNGGTTNRMPDYFGGQPQAPQMQYREPAQFAPQREVSPSGEIPYIAKQAGFPMSSSYAPSEPQSGAGWQQMAQQRYPGGGAPAQPGTIQNYLAQLLGKGAR